MSKGIALPITTEIVFSSFDACRAALSNKDLSRTFDKRSYAEGNVRQGNVSTIHGQLHRSRRRLENPVFRSERLEFYEREMFPLVLDRLLSRLVGDGGADLLIVGETVSLVLSADRAGIDIDADDDEQLCAAVEFINRFSQGSAIIDAVGDADLVRADVMSAMADWERDFLAPSRARRQVVLDQWAAGELADDDLPNDVLTLLLHRRNEAEFGLDDGVIAREVATFLHGGAHTSSQTLVNAVDLLMPLARADREVWHRIVTDPAYAQRCVHETLRLRPTTPRIKRRAEVPTRVGEVEIPEGALVIADVGAANRDPDVFGPHADEFDPWRSVADRGYLWGLTFGAGGHQCPGRNVAVGLPAAEPDALGDRHLFGLVTLMLQAFARLEPTPDPARPAQRDSRTVRSNRWATFPVRLASTAWAL